MWLINNRDWVRLSFTRLFTTMLSCWFIIVWGTVSWLVRIDCPIIVLRKFAPIYLTFTLIAISFFLQDIFVNKRFGYPLIIWFIFVCECLQRLSAWVRIFRIFDCYFHLNVTDVESVFLFLCSLYLRQDIILLNIWVTIGNWCRATSLSLRYL